MNRRVSTGIGCCNRGVELILVVTKERTTVNRRVLTGLGWCCRNVKKTEELQYRRKKYSVFYKGLIGANGMSKIQLRKIVNKSVFRGVGWFYGHRSDTSHRENVTKRDSRGAHCFCKKITTLAFEQTI